MAGKFNHHLFPTQKVVIKSADHLSETIFNHHLLITMGPLPRLLARRWQRTKLNLIPGGLRPLADPPVGLRPPRILDFLFETDIFNRKSKI